MIQWVTVVRYSHFFRVYLLEGYILQTSLSVPYRGQITKKIRKFHQVYLIEGYFPKTCFFSVITQ